MRHIHWSDLYILEPTIAGCRLGRLYRSERLYTTQRMLDEEARPWQQFINSYFTSSRKEPTVKIRMKADHSKIVDVERNIFGGPDRQWTTCNRAEGTTSYFTARVWEELPAERWEVVSARLDKEGTSLVLDWLSEPCGFPQSTMFQLPEGYRFVQFMNAFSIEKKIS